MLSDIAKSIESWDFEKLQCVRDFILAAATTSKEDLEAIAVILNNEILDRVTK